MALPLPITYLFAISIVCLSSFSLTNGSPVRDQDRGPLSVTRASVCGEDFTGYVCHRAVGGQVVRFCSETDRCAGSSDASCTCERVNGGLIWNTRSAIYSAPNVHQAVKNRELEKPRKADVGLKKTSAISRASVCPERFNGFICIKCTAGGCQRFCSRTYACPVPDDGTCACEKVSGGVIH